MYCACCCEALEAPAFAEAENLLERAELLGHTGLRVPI